MPNAIFNWSGGKDSSLSLYYLLQSKHYSIKYLLTSINENYNRVSMHGVRLELLQRQAESIGIPLYKLMLPDSLTMDEYDQYIKKTLLKLKEEGIQYSIFGDIFLEDLRKYREEQIKKVDMQAVFPIWKKSTRQLVNDFINLGFKAVIVCVNEKHLTKSFAGRNIDHDFLNDLPKNVDPCGENGEFHSFVYDGPIFKIPINFKRGEIVYKQYKNTDNQICTDKKNGFWYCDLLPN